MVSRKRARKERRSRGKRDCNGSSGEFDRFRGGVFTKRLEHLGNDRPCAQSCRLVHGGGRILIDGVDVTTFKLDALRTQVGFVLQETVLFRGTIRENIAYGRPGATEEEVIAAAKVANADEFIGRMPHGYDTVVGERGDTLSGGQRQRIGIARAVIRNSPIMILDEPTAALDTESERLVIEGLRQ